jgi:hypothetical protein
MTSEHERMQLMAASAIDGRLSATEQRELETHLGSCEDCRAIYAALRRDNAGLAEMLVPVAVPAQLRATVAEVERTGRARPRQIRQGRRLVMPSLVGVLVAVTVLTLTAGAGLWLASRQPPAPGSTAVTATATASTTSPSPGPTTATPLGGRPILAYGFDEEKDHTTLSLIDAGTGARTTLGGLPFQSVLEHTKLQWSTDHSRLLITRFPGGPSVARLEHETAAASELRIICCLPEGRYREWTLSPDGRFVAGVQTAKIGEPVTAVVIVPTDGGAQQSLPVPVGAELEGSLAWAPDGSALAIAGCGPCQPMLGKNPPIVRHAKLLVVPVDGAPIREIVDLSRATLGSPTWSPDGSQIAVSMARCPTGEAAPECSDGTTVVTSVDVVVGTVSEIAQASSDFGPGAPAWSPDGTRVAFVDGADLFVVRRDRGASDVTIASGEPATDPIWSPDGRWLLYGKATDEYDLRQLWMVSAEGGEPMLVGTARGWTW